MRSLLGYLSPYVRSLEERNEELNKERIALQNRLLHAYSGYELSQTVPSYAEAQASTKSPTNDSVLGTGVKSSVNLMQEYEDACLRAADGIADVTVRAAKEQAKEDFEKEAREYETRLAKARTDAAANSGDRNVV